MYLSVCANWSFTLSLFLCESILLSLWSIWRIQASSLPCYTGISLYCMWSGKLRTLQHDHKLLIIILNMQGNQVKFLLWIKDHIFPYLIFQWVTKADKPLYLPYSRWEPAISFVEGKNREKVSKRKENVSKNHENREKKEPRWGIKWKDPKLGQN